VFLKAPAIGLACTMMLMAQKADVSGVIRDSSGAAIEKAAVTLLHLETGIRRQSQTDASGSYVLPGIKAGTYRLSIRKPGFQTAARQGLRVEAGQHPRIDFTLLIEQAAAETVNVTSDAEPSRSIAEQGAVGQTTVKRAMIENLPLNGRGLLPLLEAAPGTVVTPAGGGEVGQFSVNGQRSNSNYVTVDGVGVNFAVNDGLPGQAPSGSTPVLTALGSMHSIVPVDALEEVKIRSLGQTAQYGRLTGAQIALETRQGGNALHGSVSTYLRNEALDANNWFSNSRGLGRAPLRASDLTATVGGPLWRNRTYFFGSHERLRLKQPFTIQSAVPDEAFRAASLPLARDFLESYPLPNGADLGGGQAEFTARVSRDSGLDSSSARIDHMFGSRAVAFGRLYQTPSSSQGAGQSLFSQGQLNLGARGFTVGVTAALSPTVLHDVRFGWATAHALYGLTPAGFDGSSAPGELSRILPPLTDPAETNYSVFVYGLEPVIQNRNNRHSQQQWNFVDASTFIRGRHEIKLGGDVRMVMPSVQSKPWNVFAVFPYLEAVAVGQMSLLTVSHQDRVQVAARNTSLFVQDSWKANSRLTLTYGLRWEYNPAISPRGGTQLAPVVGLADPKTASLSTAGTPLWNTGAGNFAPRFGVAWRPFANRSLAIRAGGGLYYDLGYGVLMNSIASSPPNYVSRTAYDVSLFDPMSKFPLPKPGLEPPFARAFAYEPGFKAPFTSQVSVGVEQNLGRAAMLSATFVDVAGHGLLRREWINKLNANFTGVEVNTNGAMSAYRALQVQFRSRSSSTLQYLVSYSLGRSMDNSSKDSELLQYGDRAARQADYGYSSFDVRHAVHGALSYEPKQWKGWGMDSIVRSRSAFPLNVVTGVDPMQLGLTSYVLRPDLVGGQALWIDDQSAPGGRRLNRNAFQVPDSRQQGSLPRNAVRGFDFVQVDLAVRKQFRITERASMQFRVEAFNALNRANLGDPQAVMTSPQFGRSLSTLNSALGSGGPANGLMPAFQIGGPRSMQVSLRFRF
jgi:hypothetical protein